MYYNTTNVYQMKRDILNFSNTISSDLSKADKHFFADMIYGTLSSSSCMLTDIANQLHESSKKINIVDRLSKHLQSGIPEESLLSYDKYIKAMIPDEPIVHIDDSDVIKPKGQKFESLGLVRDGSHSSKTKNIIEKGYIVTEACAISKSSHPISIFSRVFSSVEEDFRSTNIVTFDAIKRAASMFETCTFVMDRGYDDKKMFKIVSDLECFFVIRLKKTRNLIYNNESVNVTKIMDNNDDENNSECISITYKGKEYNDVHVSFKPVIISELDLPANFVLVYGITDSPMMLLTNKEVHNAEDAKNIAFSYFSRWKIEEYFRCKKQQFQFENFRIRKLIAINAVNFFITLCMTFLVHIQEKAETNGLKVAIIKAASPIKEKVYFNLYRISYGIKTILKYAHTGVKAWFKTERPKYRQLMLKFE